MIRSLLALLFLASGLWILPSAGAERRPNILIIMADDLGFSDLGCYGSEIETPTLDKLAGQGLRFTQFYNTAKCHSSRVSLLTGLYCDQAGGTSLSRGVTIAEVLKEAGYFTAMSGKWHLKNEPTDFGFMRYFGHLSGATNFFTGDNTFRLNGEPYKVPETFEGRNFYTTDADTSYAIKFVDEALETEKPFFLYLAYNAPHYPLHAHKEDVMKYMGRYDGGWDKLRTERHKKQLETGLLPEKWKLCPRPDHVSAWDDLSAEDKAWEARRMATFAAMVDSVDQNLKRLLGHLEKAGQLDNTIVLFLADNGACPFERTKGKEFDPWDPRSYWTYDVGWAHAGNTPFRLYKQNQHEGGISSPLIVHWPKGLKLELGSSAGDIDQTLRPTKLGPVTDQPGHLIDIMATCLELGGAKYPKTYGDRTIDPLQGKSLVPILHGKKREAHEALYFHFGTDRALRQGNWKLVSAKLGRWELYDLDADRSELNDLSTKHPERVKKMAAEWFRLAKDVDRLPQKSLKPVKDDISKLFGKGR